MGSNCECALCCCKICHERIESHLIHEKWSEDENIIIKCEKQIAIDKLGWIQPLRT